MQETIYVELAIVSQTYTPETITKVIGLESDRQWHAGDLRGQTIIVEKENGWVLHSGLPKEVDLDSHLERILDVLEPSKDAIRSLTMSATVELSVVIYSPDRPALYFDPSVIHRIEELGAGLDIDIYILPSSDEDDENGWIDVIE